MSDLEPETPAPEAPVAGPDPVLASAVELADAIEAELAAIDRALIRLEDHQYGQCELCGAPILPEILEEDPAAERCSEHPSGLTPSPERLFPS